MRSHRTPGLPPRRGLTLIELATVLALLAILLSMALPALARARRSVSGASCIQNLRQWGIATAVYALDSGDRLPPDGAPNGISRHQAWYVNLPRAVGEVPYPEAGAWRTNAGVEPPRSWWICPGNARRSNGRSLFHYCLNRHVNGTGSGSRPVRTGDLREPARTVWLFDNGGLAAVAGPNNTHPELHRAGAHFLFLDGSARHLPSPRYWDAARRRGLTNSPDLVWFP